MDASYSATGWAIVLYGVSIAGVISSLFFNKEDHILIMVMAIAVFGALGLLYESIWGPWCPAWTFCTAFSLPQMAMARNEKAEPEAVGLR